MLTVKDPSKISWVDMSLADCSLGNAMDTYFTLKLFNLFEEQLEDLGLLDFYQKLMVPSTIEISNSEFNGLDVSIEKISEVGHHLISELEKLEKELRSFTELKEDDKLDSNKDLGRVLFIPKDEDTYSDKNFNLYSPKYTKKTGEPSIDADNLKSLRVMIEEELSKR